MLIRRSIIVLFLIAIVAPLAFLIIGVWLTENNGIESLAVCFDETDSFEWTAEELQSIQLRSFRPVPGTPYIFCLFDGNMIPKVGQQQKQSIAVVIDVQKGKRILRASWTNFRDVTRFGMPRESSNPQFLLCNNEPSLFFYSQDAFYPYWVKKTIEDRTILGKILLTFFVRDIRQGVIVTKTGITFSEPVGDLVSLEGVFDYGKTFIGSEPFRDGIKEYVCENGKIVETNEWPGESARQLVPIKDIGYVGFIRRNSEMTFYFRDKKSRRMRSLDASVLYSLIPEDENSPFPFQFRRMMSVRSPTRFETQPCLFSLFSRRGIYLVELQDVDLETAPSESLFKLVGQPYPDLYPLMTVKDGSVLVLIGSPGMRPDYDTNHLAYTIREKNPDGSLGEFSRTAHNIHISKTPELICSYPIDSERLLFYRDGSLWTIRWDGQDEQRIFPI